jgi:hypothetical protein
MFILREYQRYTDQEVIDSAVEYMTKYPNAGRYQVVKNSLGNESRIRDLAKKGLVKLPHPQVRGLAWKKYFIIDPPRDKSYAPR